MGIISDINKLLLDEPWNTTNISMPTNHSATEAMPKEFKRHPTLIVFIVIGILGNILICLTICLDKKLQNMTNFFLLSLAVTDLLMNILILPVRILMDSSVLQPFDLLWCLLDMIGDDYLTSVSAMHICFISFERYLAIKNPLDTRNITKRRVYIKISLVWSISFLTVVPYITAAIINEHPTEQFWCVTVITNWKAWFDVIIFMKALMIFVMIVVVVFSFIGSTILLNRVAKMSADTTIEMVRTVGGIKSKNNTKLQVLGTEKKAVRVIWLVSFAFVIALGPYAIINMIHFCNKEIYISPVIWRFYSYLTYTNSVVNPILYSIFNKQFRNSYKNLIMCKYT